MKDTNLIIGKKNTGKTRTILFNEVKNAIKYNENLFIYNDRDEYYKEFYNELKENNYNILTLNLKDTTKSNGYNPLMLPYLLYKENQLDKATSMINNLALELFKEDNSNADPFWENMASNYFTGLVMILFKEAKIEEINIGSVQVMMTQGESKFADTTYLKKYLENVEVTSSIYSLLSPIVFAPSDTKGSIISVAKQKLNNYLLREQLLNLLNTNDINLKNIQNKTAIIVIGDRSISDLVNVFIDQFVSIVNIPFTFVLDNFDSLRMVLNLYDLVKDATYNKNKIYLAVHNEEEFKLKYSKTIIDQFENIIDMNTEANFKAFAIKLENEEPKNVDYPLLNMNKHQYLNFINLVNEMEKR
jgi:hypothetical protein